jgi:hypothetical protein
MTLSEVSDSPEQAAHYHISGSKLEVSSLNWHFPGLGVEAVILYQ